MSASEVLLERDGLLAEMSHLLADARTSTGSMLLLGGEAGIGKTSVVEAFAGSVTRADVLFGACDPLDTPRALSPLLDIVSSPGAAIDMPVDGPDDAVVLSERVLERLSRARPVVLVLEDLHWADLATLDLLRFLGRRIRQTHALVVGTFRDDELDRGHQLRVALGDLATRPGVIRRQIGTLSIESVRRLTAGSEWSPEALHEVTGGNPFFVTEVLESGDRLPRTVQDAVLARFSRLPEHARAVAEVVSIAPRHVSLELALRVGGAQVSAADDAVASGVLVHRNGFISFRHDLARSAIEESLPPGRRWSLHRAMIEALEISEPPDHARLAHHASRAGMADLVARYAPLAARQAASKGSFREAARFFELALQPSGTISPAERTEIRMELAASLTALGRSDESLAHAELAVDERRQRRDPASLGRALSLLSFARWNTNDHDGARGAIDEALDLLGSAGSSSDRALALQRSASLYMLARRHEPAMRHARLAVDVAGQTGDVGLGTRVLSTYGAVECVTGDATAGVHVMLEAVDRLRALDDDLALMAELVGRLGSGAGEVRRYEVAVAALVEGLVLAARRDADATTAYAHAWLARIAFERGLWDEATSRAKLVLENPGRTTHAAVTALGALGRVRVRRGDPGGRDVLERALELGARAELQHLWPAACGLAELAITEGRPDEAANLLRPYLDRALGTDSAWAKGELAYWMDRSGALGSIPNGAAAPFVHLMTAEWRQAASTWEALGCPFERATALMMGDEISARQAIEVFSQLEAKPALDATRERLRALGVASVPRGPRAGTLENPGGLTARQLEVAGLMATGLDNREIADRLFVSPKTVEHHISAIFGKLGVANRGRAIARARELGIELGGEGPAT